MPKKQQTTGQTTLQLPHNNPRPGTPNWALQQLTQPRTNYHHDTQLTTCTHCAAIILYGYADGWPTQTDPINLTHHTQTIIHAAGRPLYQLTTNTTGTAYRLHLATGPNDALTVLTNHKCHYPPPDTNILTPKPATYPPGSPPPF
ncbi:hypothetical protein VVR12_03250 [Rothia sp. LK2588]|uniref:hypothetical protein n=1 Tax=Rothia sp. LK2588 TaxID=3114369 RepID=UPI0034CF1ED5